MIGILPTLRATYDGQAMSPNPRYKLLNEQIFAARGEEMRIAIEGPEKLFTHMTTIMPEALAPACRCHLQVSPDDFASNWNAAQAIAARRSRWRRSARSCSGRALAGNQDHAVRAGHRPGRTS